MNATEESTLSSEESLLTAAQARVLGCLLEKQLATPDSYPMTLKALTNACNQTTSRFPVVDYAETLVDTTLHALKAKRLVRFVHPSHGERSTKYRQVIDETQGFDEAERAIIALLLLRGAQTTAELRTRSERLHSFSSPQEVESVLEQLSSRSPAVVSRIGRQTGQKGERWIQLLEAGAEQRAEVLAPGVVSSSGGGTRDEIDRLKERVERLERQMGLLMEALGSDLA